MVFHQQMNIPNGVRAAALNAGQSKMFSQMRGAYQCGAVSYCECMLTRDMHSRSWQTRTECAGFDDNRAERFELGKIGRFKSCFQDIQYGLGATIGVATKSPRLNLLMRRRP